VEEEISIRKFCRVMPRRLTISDHLLPFHFYSAEIQLHSLVDSHAFLLTIDMLQGIDKCCSCLLRSRQSSKNEWLFLYLEEDIVSNCPSLGSPAVTEGPHLFKVEYRSLGGFLSFARFKSSSFCSLSAAFLSTLSCLSRSSASFLFRNASDASLFS
jgi:hypothetical protein